MRLIAAILLALAFIGSAQAQLNPNGFPLTTLAGTETVDCQPAPTNPPTSPWITTCTTKQIAQVITVLPNTWTQPQTINTTGLTTIHGPGSPLFIWANPGASIPAGYNPLRVWMGDNPTATPANPGTVAATIAGLNGNGRTNVWAANFIAGQSSAVIGAAQGALTGLEIDTFSDTAYTQATTPFGANPVTNLQLYNSPAISKVTNAITIWAPDTTGAFWFYEGISLSRYINYGLHFYHLASDPSSTASIFDASHATASYLATGTFTNVLDVSGATFTNLANCGSNVCAIVGQASVSSILNLTGVEGDQLLWTVGGGSGYQFTADLSTIGTWYLHDVTGMTFPFIVQAATPTSALTLSAANGVQVGTRLMLPLATWTDTQTCVAGQISIDTGFVYVCTATNTVKRAALSSF